MVCGVQHELLEWKEENVNIAFDCWVAATLAALVIWMWQRQVRNEGPPILSIQLDEEQIRKQKAFIQKIDRLRSYMRCFVTALAALGIATAVAWLFQNLS